MKWAYGVTTVPERAHTLLPRTLTSLGHAGFDAPHLFVDGCTPAQHAEYHSRYGERVTCRGKRVRTAGNWVLSLYELYLLDPAADRYAVFQDDLIACRGLRDYLSVCVWPEKGYLNLYTTLRNWEICPPGHTGWYLSNQFGRGAVGLAFTRQAVHTLLTAKYLVERPQDQHRGHRAVDGGIVESFKAAGWTEWVHNPSLVQHTGERSSMGNNPHRPSPCFRGEGFDAMMLIRKENP